MRWGQRAARAIRDFVTRQADTHEEPPAEPREAPEPRGRGRGRTGDTFSEPTPSQLPPGWVLAGLYHQGEKTQRIHATDDTEVTDGEIAAADALIVWYEDAGGDGYRWIHGATDWDSLSDQIARTIMVVSPAGRGE